MEQRSVNDCILAGDGLGCKFALSYAPAAMGSGSGGDNCHPLRFPVLCCADKLHLAPLAIPPVVWFRLGWGWFRWVVCRFPRRRLCRRLGAKLLGESVDRVDGVEKFVVIPHHGFNHAPEIAVRHPRPFNRLGDGDAVSG